MDNVSYYNFCCAFYLGEVPFMTMGKAEPCPSGTEITTSVECDHALLWHKELMTTIKKETLNHNSWDFIPHQCSYANDQGYFFNKIQPSTMAKILDGEYKMVCKKGKIYFRSQLFLYERIILQVYRDDKLIII